jgi:hypothetical protein
MRKFLLCAMLVSGSAFALPQGTSYWAAIGTCGRGCAAEGHKPPTARAVVHVRGARICGGVQQDFGAAYANKSPYGVFAGRSAGGLAVVGYVDSFTETAHAGAASLEFRGGQLQWTTVLPTLVLHLDQFRFKRVSPLPENFSPRTKSEIMASCEEFFQGQGGQAVRDYLERFP